jgi:hypothetical protein
MNNYQMNYRYRILKKGTVLLQGTKICDPQELQECVVDLAHESHPGKYN